jgi:hypothetical protein
MDQYYNWLEDDSLEHVCDWISYRTHHNDMDAPQYVLVDVISDIQGAWMIYHTHHNDIYAPQNV